MYFQWSLHTNTLINSVPNKYRLKDTSTVLRFHDDLCKAFVKARAKRKGTY